MRSAFNVCAVLLASILATGCVEGFDGADEFDENGEIDETDLTELESTEVMLPEAPAPEVVTPGKDSGDSVQVRRNDDPDEGGQIKRRPMSPFVAPVAR